MISAMDVMMYDGGFFYYRAGLAEILIIDNTDERKNEMKKLKMKRFLGLVLTFALVLTSVPLTGLAETEQSAVTSEEDAENEPVVLSEDGIVASGTCGENLTWELDSEGTLTISGTGDMCDFEYNQSNHVVSSPWFDICDQIITLKIANEITSIGAYAFYNCNSLSSITLSENLISIGSDAFASCINLVEVQLPDSVTTIGYEAFHGCSSLSKFVIPANTTNFSQSTLSRCNKLITAGPLGSGSNIEFGWTNSIPDYAFDGCISLIEIEFPEKLKEIGEGAFLECGISEISLPDSVESIESNAFASCNKLKRVVLPENLSSIGQYAFSRCENLEYLFVPGSLIDIESRWISNCPQLSTVGPVGSGCSVEFEWTNSIPDGAFAGCDITSIVIPDTIVNIGSGAFGHCDDLINVEIANGVKNIGEEAFYYCESLASIQLPESVESIDSDAFAYCKSLSQVIIPENLKNIGSRVFSYCPKLISAGPLGSESNIEFGWSDSIPDNGLRDCFDLVSIILPETLTTIGNYAFGSCKKISTIKLPDHVTEIGEYAFAGCTSIEEIEIPNKVSTISVCAFSNCGKLTSILLPDSITTIGSKAFGYCDNLSQIIIPKSVNKITPEDHLYYGITYDCDNLLTVGPSDGDYNIIIEWDEKIPNYVFYKCNNIEKIVIPDGVSVIGERAFSNCENLVSVTIPNSVTKFQTVSMESAFYKASKLTTAGPLDGDYNIKIGWTNSIPSSAFAYNNYLKSIVIPDGIEKIGGLAFYKCTKLEDVSIAESVTDIEGNAFSECESIVDIHIPENVSKIGSEAFENCNNLENIYFVGNFPNIEEDIFLGVTATAYYPYNDSTWTEDSLQNYGGTITWKKWNPETGEIYEDENPSSEDFSITSSPDYCIIGEQKLISGSYVASNGNAESEVRAIEWVSSAPEIAEVSLLSCDSNSEKVYFTLTIAGHKAGIAKITGTAEDGRSVSFEISVEPEMQIAIPSKISTESNFLCSIELDSANSDYLELFMDNLSYKFESDGGLVIVNNSSFEISNDGLSAVYTLNVMPDESGDESISFISANGQTINSSFTVTAPESEIVKRVKEYTSDALYAAYNEISNSDYSPEEQFKRYQELFNRNGFTDVKEGINYLSNTTDKRYAYLYLTTDDIYCASNYEYWLNNTKKGAVARGLLLADGLIFNGEINDWLDFSTYIESDYPGVAKYKAMLYDFMDAGSTKVEILSSISAVSALSKNATNAAKIRADDLIKQLNTCTKSGEARAILEKAESEGVFAELSNQRDADGKVTLSYNMDKSSGFGQFSKAMGIACKGITIANLVVTDVIDLIELDSKLAIYEQYRTFLTDVFLNLDLPFEMRWAASQILDEMEYEYLYKIKDVAIQILEQQTIVPNNFAKLLAQLGYSSLGEWLMVINIESFFINKVANIGEMVQEVATIEGYAKLAEVYAQCLEESKQAFVNNKTDANAWAFYYNYTILYQLRYRGEKAYLALNDVKGAINILTQNAYEVKKAVVEDTLEHLISNCQFNLDEEVTLSEAVQYSKKVVINCPVNVEIYEPDGSLIETLYDNVSSDVINDFGRFAVVYQPYSNDYAKVLCFNDDRDYVIKIIGTDDGLVNLNLASVNDDIIYSFSNICIEENDGIQASLNQIIEDKCCDFDKNNDGIIDSQIIVVTHDTNYIPVESISFESKEIELAVGETAILDVKLTPSNATNTDINWVSSDSDIVTVTDGKIKAITEGKATVFCISVDNPDLTAECIINVDENVESHSHTYSYIDNGDGTHTKSCTAGDDTSIEKHTYQDGTCTLCGAEEPIDTIDLSSCKMALSKAEYTYDGSEKEPTVTITNGDQILEEGTDYTVTYSNNVNAGTASVTATGQGNYTGTITETFTIKKADQEIKATISSANLVEKETATIEVNAATGALSYSSSDTAVATVDEDGVVTAVSVGTATISITAEGNENYNPATTAIEITVTEKPQPHTHEYGDPVFEWAEDYSCKAVFTCKDKDDEQTIDCTVTSEVTDSTCTKDGETVYTATVEFDGQNYTDAKTVPGDPATGHSYEYTDNGDGTHTATCVNGDDSFTEDHVFKDSVCICGAKEEATSESESSSEPESPAESESSEPSKPAETVKPWWKAWLDKWFGNVEDPEETPEETPSESESATEPEQPSESEPDSPTEPEQPSESAPENQKPGFDIWDWLFGWWW